MLKLIIVDDHKHIVDGMKKYVDWSSIGIEVIDVANNGVEGIEKIEKHKPDIVLTDIAMPIKDGFEMIEALTDKGIRPKFVLLTGYSEFEYAKDAIKYSVMDYIVKPALPGKIIETMKKVAKVCIEEKNIVEQHRKISRQLLESKPILIEKFLEELFEGTIKDDSESIDRLKFLDIDFEDKIYIVLAVQIDGYESFVSKHTEEDRFFLRYSITSLISESLSIPHYSVSFKGKNAFFLLTVSVNETNFNDLDLSTELADIIDKCMQLYDMSISIGVGEVVNKPLDIKDSYLQAIESTKYKMYFGNGKVIFYKDIVHTQIFSPVLYYYDKSMLIDGLKMRSRILVDQCLDSIFTTIRRCGYVRIDLIKVIIYELLGTTIFTIHQIGERLPDEYFESGNIWGDIEAKETLDEIEHYVKDLFDKILKSSGAKINQRSVRIVEQILDYINFNYHNNISLNDLSKKIFLTPNYLSILFSKEIGKTFNDYLTEFRIKKAKELLQLGNYKVYEVGEKVGYKNLDYFRKVFKEYTGKNPSDFIM